MYSTFSDGASPRFITCESLLANLPAEVGDCNDACIFLTRLDSARLPALGAPVAQLDRALVYETKGRRFEPCRARFIPLFHFVGTISPLFFRAVPLAGSGTPQLPVGPEVRVPPGEVQVIA